MHCLSRVGWCAGVYLAPAPETSKISRASEMHEALFFCRSYCIGLSSTAVCFCLQMIAPLVTALLGFTLLPTPTYRGVSAPRVSEPFTLSADRIRRRDAIGAAVLGVAMVPAARSDAEEPSYPKVKITTTAGAMEFELWSDVAPKHVESFLKLTKQGFYDGGAFHRIIPGFVIQGGDPNAKVGYGPVR